MEFRLTGLHQKLKLFIYQNKIRGEYILQSLSVIKQKFRFCHPINSRVNLKCNSFIFIPLEQHNLLQDLNVVYLKQKTYIIKNFVDR